MRCKVRMPSAMPPVPAGVMLDVNDDAMRERSAGANGTGSATEPTNETAAKKYVSALPSEHERASSSTRRRRTRSTVSPMFASCGSRK